MTRTLARVDPRVDLLAEAIAFGDWEGAGRLLRDGVGVDAVDESFRTPLMNAALHAQPRLVRLLLAAGADPDARPDEPFDAFDGPPEEHGATAMMLAAKEDMDAASRQDMLTALTAAGAYLDARDTQGRTPLHYAVAGAVGDAVEVLLQLGADPGVADLDGLTPAAAAREALAGPTLREGERRCLERILLRLDEAQGTPRSEG